MKALLAYDLPQLTALMAEMGQPAYRAGQLFTALQRDTALKDVSVLPVALRTKMAEDGYYSDSVTIITTLTSAKDGTQKFLFRLRDGNVVEGVLMRYKYGNTLCISTQVGCRMACAFCASGIGGLVRNMTADEIVAEVIAVNALAQTDTQRNVTNVVLMGTGEPLDNLDNVLRFIHLITAEKGINISRRNISLSTSGLLDGIERLTEADTDVNLTISLHNPFDEERLKIMPVTAKNPVREVIAAARNYFEKTGRRVYFEYCMIEGVNDSPRHAKALSVLLAGFPCHVNLIRLNYVKEKGLKGTDSESIKRFMALLEQGHVSCTLRRNLGSDIDGACGQLRKKYMDGEE